MKTELTYLLEQLENYESNTPLTTGLLIEIINASFNNYDRDQEVIDASMDVPGI